MQEEEKDQYQRKLRSYSDIELMDILSNIDRERFHNRYQLVSQELTHRREQGITVRKEESPGEYESLDAPRRSGIFAKIGIFLLIQAVMMLTILLVEAFSPPTESKSGASFMIYFVLAGYPPLFVAGLGLTNSLYWGKQLYFILTIYLAVAGIALLITSSLSQLSIGFLAGWLFFTGLNLVLLTILSLPSVQSYLEEQPGGNPLVELEKPPSLLIRILYATAIFYLVLFPAYYLLDLRLGWYYPILILLTLYFTILSILKFREVYELSSSIVVHVTAILLYILHLILYFTVEPDFPTSVVEMMIPFSLLLVILNVGGAAINIFLIINYLRLSRWAA